MLSILNQIKGLQLPEMEVGEPFEIVIKREPKEVQTEQSETVMKVGKSYKITVKKYMTEPATVSFDFQDKWNNGMPMPLVTMTGEVIKETRGMFYMRLHTADQEWEGWVIKKSITNFKEEK